MTTYDDLRAVAAMHGISARAARDLIETFASALANAEPWATNTVDQARIIAEAIDEELSQ